MTNLRIEDVSISSLTTDPDNLRFHDQTNLEAIKNSLNRFGQRKPIVVNNDNVVIAGNGQYLAAKELGWTTIQIARTPKEWSKQDEIAYAIADNRTNDLSHFDNEALLQALESFDLAEIKDMGFTEADLADLSKAWAEPADLDDLFKEVGEPTEDDNQIKVEFKLDPETFAKWQACLTATGTNGLDAIFIVIHAAYDALIKDE